MSEVNNLNGRSQDEHPVKPKITHKPKDKAPKPPPCRHPNLVPYVMRSERLVYAGSKHIVDRCCSIINGQWLRVEKYYCPGCKQFIEPPKE